MKMPPDRAESNVPVSDAPKDTPEARRYHREFVRHARAMLPDDTFTALHRKARGSAGGLAPRTPKSNDDAEPIKKAQAGFFEGMRAFWQSMFGPSEPLSLPAPTEREDDVYRIYAEPVEKEMPTSSDVHVPVPIGAEKPFLAKKKKRNDGTKRKKKATGTLPPPKGITINKDAEIYDEIMAEIEEADGIEPPEERRGLAVHLNGDTKREPGFLAALNSSAVLPDGCAEVVLVQKARGPEHRAQLLNEAKRLLIPDGKILSEESLEDLLRGDLEKQLEFKHMLKKSVDSEESGLMAVLKEAPKHTPGEKAGLGADALEEMTEARRSLIVKSLDRELPIAGLNRKRQLIYAPALVPNEVHHSYDWMTPEDIEHTAHRYMTGARAIGAEHRGAIDAECVESFIAPQDLDFSGEYESPYGETKIPKGSWMVTIHVKDKDQWAKVESGEYTGISVGGFGLREALTAD